MNQNPKRISGPGVEPVTLAEVKSFIKQDGTSDDDLLNSLITASRERIEDYLNRTLICTTWELSRDFFPTASASATYYDDSVLESVIDEYQDESLFYNIAQSSIHLPMGEVTDIDEITYFDKDNNSVSVDNDLFILGNDDAVHLNEAKSWPSMGLLRKSNAVRIVFEAGYGDEASDVPQAIKTSIKMMVQAMYDDPECGCIIDGQMKMLLLPYRIKRKMKAHKRRIERS